MTAFSKLQRMGGESYLWSSISSFRALVSSHRGFGEVYRDHKLLADFNQKKVIAFLKLQGMGGASYLPSSILPFRMLVPSHRGFEEVYRDHKLLAAFNQFVLINYKTMLHANLVANNRTLASIVTTKGGTCGISSLRLLLPLQRRSMSHVAKAQAGDLVKSKENSFVINNQALSKRLEDQGMSLGHAKAIVEVLNELLDESSSKISLAFIPKDKMMRENQFHLLHHDQEKRMRCIDEKCNELRCEFKRVDRKKRSALVSEKGSILNEINRHGAEIHKLLSQVYEDIYKVKEKAQSARFTAVTFSLPAIVCALLVLFKENSV